MIAELTDNPIPDLMPDRAYILRRMITAARQIRSNGQFKRILRKVDAAEREALYDTLKPHLSFRAKPFSRLGV